MDAATRMAKSYLKLEGRSARKVDKALEAIMDETNSVQSIYEDWKCIKHRYTRANKMQRMSTSRIGSLNFVEVPAFCFRSF